MTHREHSPSMRRDVVHVRTRSQRSAWRAAILLVLLLMLVGGPVVGARAESGAPGSSKPTADRAGDRSAHAAAKRKKRPTGRCHRPKSRHRHHGQRCRPPKRKPTSSNLTAAERQALIAALPDLPPPARQLVINAVSRLSPTRIRSLIAGLQALPAGQESTGAQILQSGLAGLATATQQALVDDVLGIANASEQQQVAAVDATDRQTLLTVLAQQATVGMQGFPGDLPASYLQLCEAFALPYPPQTAAGCPQALTASVQPLVLPQPLGEWIADAQALTSGAIDRAPAALRPLLDISDTAKLRAEAPGSVIDAVLFVRAAHTDFAIANLDSAEASAINDCVYFSGPCTAGDIQLLELYFETATQLPDPLRQAFADCFESVCPPDELHAILTYIQQRVQDNARSQALFNAAQQSICIVGENWWQALGDTSLDPDNDNDNDNTTNDPDSDSYPACH